MESILSRLAEWIALGVETSACVIIAYGAIEAVWGVLVTLMTGTSSPGRRKAVWLHFGMWLLLGLEFELAADIVRTAISPSWSDIGQLASIGVIRTFLNYFLEKDLEKYGETRSVAVALRDSTCIREAT